MKYRRLLALVISAIMLITAIPVMAEEHNFYIENGGLISYSGPGGEVVIPDGVTKVYNGAFDKCYSIESIEIPDSLTSISSSSFEHCSSFKGFKVKDSHKCFSTVDGVLFDKEGKTLICYPVGKTETSYTVPSSVKVIAEYAFYECENLRALTLSSRLSFIESNGLFCRNLEILNIPRGVTRFAPEYIKDCSNLTRIYVAMGNPSYASKNGILYSADMKELICCPAGVGGSVTVYDGVESIGERAFQRCKKITEVILPEGLTTIKAYAFSNCSGLSSVKLPDSLKKINDSAFSFCPSLNSIYIPDGVERISGYVFSNTPINEFIIPEGVTKVEQLAFGVPEKECIAAIPKSVKINMPYTVIPNHYTKVYCFEGSDIDAYCKKFKYPVIYMPESDTDGDADGNGRIDIWDVAEILKYIAKWKNSLNIYSSDVNNDGMVNVADTTLIMKYIAGWNVELK